MTVTSDHFEGGQIQIFRELVSASTQRPQKISLARRAIAKDSPTDLTVYQSSIIHNDFYSQFLM